MSIRQEHLDFFKSLLEGTASRSWNAWFWEHDEQLRDEMPRAAYLRLKFKNIEGAERLLQLAGVDYQRNESAIKWERYCSSLHRSALNDDGRPNDRTRRKAYDGAFGYLLDGNKSLGVETLQNIISRICRLTPLRQADELNDMAFDGEMELRFGHANIGRRLLEAVASVPEGDDLTDPPIQNAKKLLRQ